jgi:2-polyprenyl-6-methoxyphenol hydroxylase-like FAD-dependent oxidoreductase
MATSGEALIQVDVLVVGAGPAGLVAGITLARYGVSVLVVEKRAENPRSERGGVRDRLQDRTAGEQRLANDTAANTRGLRLDPAAPRSMWRASAT